MIARRGKPCRVKCRGLAVGRKSRRSALKSICRQRAAPNSSPSSRVVADEQPRVAKFVEPGPGTKLNHTRSFISGQKAGRKGVNICCRLVQCRAPSGLPRVRTAPRAVAHRKGGQATTNNTVRCEKKRRPETAVSLLRARRQPSSQRVGVALRQWPPISRPAHAGKKGGGNVRLSCSCNTAWHRMPTAQAMARPRYHRPPTMHTATSVQ